MKFFHISIVWISSEKDAQRLSPIFNLAQDWLFYGNSNWIIYTSESINTWQDRIRAVVADEDYFFMCEITNVMETAGWMKKWVWDWLRKDRATILPPLPNFGGILPPPR
jgi:hypothetical protein